MTLHEAIKEILVDSKRELTPSELAKLINDNKLYVRKDKRRVTASQIMARINRYSKLFSKTGNKISLKGFNKQELFEEEIKKHLKEFLNQLYQEPSFKKSFVLPFLLRSVIEMDNDPGSIRPNEFFQNILRSVGFGRLINFLNEDIFSPYLRLINKIQQHSNRNRILQKLIYWVNDAVVDNDLIILPEYICAIIGKYDFYDENNILRVSSNMFSNFILNIYENNPNSEFVFSYFNGFRNEEVERLNSFLLGAAHSREYSYSIENTRDIAIVTPPWFVRERNQKWSSNYRAIMENIERGNGDFDKALLIVPESAVFGGGKDLNSREILTQEQCVESVVTIPFKSSFTNIKSAALITFDFQNRSKDVFFADLNQLENFDIETEWKRVNSIINQKEIIEGVSTIVNTNEIFDNEYTWFPQKYILKSQDFEEKADHETVSIKSILKNWFKGRNIDRKKLYEGGELKYLRTTELSDESVYINLSENILGVDHDEIDRKVFPESNSVVVTLIGSKLKASVLPGDFPLLFNSHLAVLELDTDKVIPEFLAYELRESYIQQQLEYYRKGTTIPTISLGDFLELKVQVPSLELQKDILLTKNRTDFKVESNEQAFDYIATLKHTLKQQLKTLSSDLVSLKKFLSDLDNSDKSVSLDDIIVSIFPGEDASNLSDYKLSMTLERMTRSLGNAHSSLDQAQNALEIESIKKSKFEIKELFEEIKSSYPKLDIKISGKKQEILADRAQIRMVITNIINNALKHGFTEENKPWIVELKSIPQKANEPLLIDITNNGKPFPSDFKTEEFLSKGGKAGDNQGTGFGGYLINKIIKNHKGKIELIPTKEIEFEKYNVKFIISLPKL